MLIIIYKSVMSAVTGHDSAYYCERVRMNIHLAGTWDGFHYFFKCILCNYSPKESLRGSDRFSCEAARRFDFVKVFLPPSENRYSWFLAIFMLLYVYLLAEALV